jgi:ATP-dependent Clp protease ATP-binding subunit ClpA
MMFERFTKAARAAVKDAQQHAVRGAAEQVRPEHLLLGLLDQEDTAVATVRGLGAEPEALRDSLAGYSGRYPDGLDEDDAEALRTIGIDLEEVSRRIGADLRPRAGSALPPFSRPAKKALELSLRDSLALGHRHIGTEHLLLGLARGGDRVVGDALADCGLTGKALRTAVAEAARRAG